MEQLHSLVVAVQHFLSKALLFLPCLRWPFNIGTNYQEQKGSAERTVKVRESVFALLSAVGSRLARGTCSLPVSRSQLLDNDVVILKWISPPFLN